MKKPQYVGLWYGHWRTGSKTLFFKKNNNPVCQTVIRSLAS